MPPFAALGRPAAGGTEGIAVLQTFARNENRGGIDGYLTSTPSTARGPHPELIWQSTPRCSA